MGTKVQVQPTSFTTCKPGADAELASNQDWHAPVITRIDTRRTMSAAGSGVDSINASGDMLDFE